MAPRKDGVQFLSEITLKYCFPALLLNLDTSIGKEKNNEEE
jgi:hypothetical protein